MLSDIGLAYIFGSVSSGNGNKNKNKQMWPRQTFAKQSKLSTKWKESPLKGEGIYKW